MLFKACLIAEALEVYQILKTSVFGHGMVTFEMDPLSTKLCHWIVIVHREEGQEAYYQLAISYKWTNNLIHQPIGDCISYISKSVLCNHQSSYLLFFVLPLDQYKGR